MNPDHSEKLLRQAPRPRVPEGLREKLEADIALSRPTLERRPRLEGHGLKRWLPALSLTVFFFGCLVAIAVQSNLISELRQQNEGMRVTRKTAEEQNATSLQSQSAEKNQELSRLHRDAAELHKLTEEAARLREQLAELPALREANLRFKSQGGDPKTEAEREAGLYPPGLTAEHDVFGRGRAKTQAILCINNIKQICLAARLWANEHKDTMPSDFLALKNTLPSPRFLICPDETTKDPAPNWTAFSPANSSYEMLSPGVDETDPGVVYVRCTIHGSVGLVDGSAHMLPPNGLGRVVQQDGKYLLGR